MTAPSAIHTQPHAISQTPPPMLFNLSFRLPQSPLPLPSRYPPARPAPSHATSSEPPTQTAKQPTNTRTREQKGNPDSYSHLLSFFLAAACRKLTHAVRPVPLPLLTTERCARPVFPTFSVALFPFGQKVPLRPVKWRGRQHHHPRHTRHIKHGHKQDGGGVERAFFSSPISAGLHSWVGCAIMDKQERLSAVAAPALSVLHSPAALAQSFFIP